MLFKVHSHGASAAAILPPATKLGQGYILTGVCDSVPMGGVPAPGRLCAGGRGSTPMGGGLLWGGAGGDPPRTATAAGGTHPTGMHTCLPLQLDSIITNGVPRCGNGNGCGNSCSNDATSKWVPTLFCVAAAVADYFALTLH